MKRLLGTTSGTQAPDLNSLIAANNQRIAEQDVVIRKAEAQRQNIAREKKGLNPASSEYKRLARKLGAENARIARAVEIQRPLESQNYNFESIQSNIALTTGVAAQVQTMKASNKALKKQLKSVNLDKIDQLQDEMAELMELGNEIQESLGRGYEVPEMDEDELAAELDALGDEMEFETEIGKTNELGFMQSEVPAFIDEAPEGGKVKEVA